MGEDKTMEGYDDDQTAARAARQRSVGRRDASVRRTRKISGWTRQGERVALLLPSSVAAEVTFFALHAIGRTPTWCSRKLATKMWPTPLIRATPISV